MARGRPPLAEPTLPLTVRIEEKLLARLNIELHSQVEGRVPKGSYRAVFEMLLRRFWEHKQLDLAPYLGTMPGEAIVHATPAVLERLRNLLESHQ